jgi:predicted transcriptional regulator of viral defense system
MPTRMAVGMRCMARAIAVAQKPCPWLNTSSANRLMKTAKAMLRILGDQKSRRLTFRFVCSSSLLRGRDEQLHYTANRTGRQGAYSHQTALSLYELSELNPAKLHMAIPAHFRRNSEISGILVLHMPSAVYRDKCHGLRYTGSVDQSISKPRHRAALGVGSEQAFSEVRQASVSETPYARRGRDSW